MNSNHKIKAIFFDLDGTLRHSVPEGGQVSDEYVRTLGLQLHEEDILRAARWEYLYWANSADLRDDLGLTYLFVAHDLSVVRHISDRVAVMYVGRLAELADVDRLFARPRHPSRQYTSTLMVVQA